MVLFDDVEVSEKEHLVSVSTLHTFGFGGWWRPRDSEVAVFESEGVRVPVVCTKPWDGAPLGRLGMIVEASPPRDRDLLNKFFMRVDPIQCVLAEVRRGWMGWQVEDEKEWARELALRSNPTRPLIVIGRYRDNCYLAFLSMSNSLIATMKVAVDALLRSIYCTPLKWEPSERRLTWGEASILFLSHGPSLRRKGTWDVGMDLSEVSTCEWDRWVHKDSPNARFTLRSTLPSLALTSIWMAASITDLRANLRSLYMGVGWCAYPPDWWKGLMKRCLKTHGLMQLLSFQECEAWVRDGKLLKVQWLGNTSVNHK
jgi:hypothetical protein